MSRQRGPILRRALSSVVLTMAVILATAFAGQAYAYCRTMHRVMAPGCSCDPARASAESAGLELSSRATLQQELNAPCFDFRIFDRIISDAPHTPAVRWLPPATTPTSTQRKQ
jgi:hypothetical protein